MLLQVSLGSDAKDELHVVAVESRNMSNVHKPVSIATLERSVLPMVTLFSHTWNERLSFNCHLSYLQCLEKQNPYLHVVIHIVSMNELSSSWR